MVISDDGFGKNTTKQKERYVGELQYGRDHNHLGSKGKSCWRSNHLNRALKNRLFKEQKVRRENFRWSRGKKEKIVKILILNFLKSLIEKFGLFFF